MLRAEAIKKPMTTGSLTRPKVNSNIERIADTKLAPAILFIPLFVWNKNDKKVIIKIVARRIVPKEPRMMLVFTN